MPWTNMFTVHLGTFWQYNTRLMLNRTTVLSANNFNRKSIKCRQVTDHVHNPK